MQNAPRPGYQRAARAARLGLPVPVGYRSLESTPYRRPRRSRRRVQW